MTSQYLTSLNLINENPLQDKQKAQGSRNWPKGYLFSSFTTGTFLLERKHITIEH